MAGVDGGIQAAAEQARQASLDTPLRTVTLETQIRPLGLESARGAFLATPEGHCVLLLRDREDPEESLFLLERFRIYLPGNLFAIRLSEDDEPFGRDRSVNLKYVTWAGGWPRFTPRYSMRWRDENPKALALPKTPRLLKFTFAPRGPTDQLTPPLPKFIRTPGASLNERRNRSPIINSSQGISIFGIRSLGLSILTIQFRQNWHKVRTNHSHFTITQVLTQSGTYNASSLSA